MNDLGNIPLYSNRDECGYFSNQESCLLFTTARLYCEKNKLSTENFNEKAWFSALIEKGFRRNGEFFYINSCNGCNECTPIRIPVRNFVPSKSQRAVLRKNADVEMRLVTDSSQFVTDEKVLIFREYDFYHNGKLKSLEETREQLESMTSGYSGVWNLEFYIEGKLAGVSILDYGFDDSNNISVLSSNYFYYDTSAEILKRSIGVFSVLKELEICQQKGIPYYYLGLYLPNCRKMNYKIKYRPYELLIQGKWVLTPADINSVVNPDFLIKFPNPGELYDDDDVCCLTESMDVQMLYSAYMQGIFPWFNEDSGDPVVWQCPKNRFILKKEDFHVSKSIRKVLKKNPFTYTVDKCFSKVVKNCAEQNRAGQLGTWIGPKIKKTYTDFHKAGYAHSFEAWKDGQLAGGFYGIVIGSIFCGESMFTKESESSKTAFVLFATKFFQAGGQFIDCQAQTENMARYGAKEIPREEFLEMLKAARNIKMPNLFEELSDIFK